MTEPRVLVSTRHLLAVDKPEGLMAVPDRKRQPSVLEWAEAHVGQKGRPDLHPASRLDLGVSGVMTFTRTPEANAHYAAGGRIKKIYVALGTLKDPGSGGATSIWNQPIDGKPAETHATLIATARGHGLFKLVPVTGRTHQLRIHASLNGAPLLGDRKYGGLPRLSTPRGVVLPIERLFLHALLVRYVDPLPGDPTDPVVAPLSRLFELLWSSLDGRAEAWEELGAICGLSSVF